MILKTLNFQQKRPKCLQKFEKVNFILINTFFLILAIQTMKISQEIPTLKIFFSE